jgi:rhamnosyltransferase
LKKNALLIPMFRLMQFWGTYRGSAQFRPLDNKLRQTFYYPRGLERQDHHAPTLSNGSPIDYANKSGEEEIVG